MTKDMARHNSKECTHRERHPLHKQHPMGLCKWSWCQGLGVTPSLTALTCRGQPPAGPSWGPPPQACRSTCCQTDPTYPTISTPFKFNMLSDRSNIPDVQRAVRQNQHPPLSAHHSTCCQTDPTSLMFNMLSVRSTIPHYQHTIQHAVRQIQHPFPHYQHTL